MNDISIITGIIGFFLVLGVIMPYVDADFGTDSGITQSDLNDDIEDSVESASVVSIIDVFISVLQVFFSLTLSGFNIFIKVIIWILRVVLVLTIARNVWVGGGG